jgi:hypothetical protein
MKGRLGWVILFFSNTEYLWFHYFYSEKCFWDVSVFYVFEHFLFEDRLAVYGNFKIVFFIYVVEKIELRGSIKLSKEGEGLGLSIFGFDNYGVVSGFGFEGFLDSFCCLLFFFWGVGYLFWDVFFYVFVFRYS